MLLRLQLAGPRAFATAVPGRRLAAAAGIGAGFSSFTRPAIAAELARKQRQVLVIWLAGGASQLETWDPKPKTDTGGPFRSIETSVPGVRISELLAQDRHADAPAGSPAQHQHQ